MSTKVVDNISVYVYVRIEEIKLFQKLILELKTRKLM